MADEREFEDGYVYLYRDPETNDIIYVGRGKGRDRSLKHFAKGSHNPALQRHINRLARTDKAPIVELAGPFGEQASEAVESALISALWGTSIVNGRQERKAYLFRPLGLPASCAARRYDDRLTRRSVADLGGAVVVYINSRTLSKGEVDERRGAVPTLEVDDAAILVRFDRWWQLKSDAEQWSKGPARAPRLLLGVTGPQDRRWVLGAIEIDHTGWDSTEAAGALRVVPTRSRNRPGGRASLDAEKLRGRYLAPRQFGGRVTETGHVFGAIRSHAYDVVPPSRSWLRGLGT